MGNSRPDLLGWRHGLFLIRKGSRPGCRLIKLLLSLVYDLLPDAEAWAKPVALPVRISQEQLASMTGSTQPTGSDLLQKLHKAGLIAIARRQITIGNPLQLLAHAEEIIED